MLYWLIIFIVYSAIFCCIRPPAPLIEKELTERRLNGPPISVGFRVCDFESCFKRECGCYFSGLTIEVEGSDTYCLILCCFFEGVSVWFEKDSLVCWSMRYVLTSGSSKYFLDSILLMLGVFCDKYCISMCRCRSSEEDCNGCFKRKTI